MTLSPASVTGGGTFTGKITLSKAAGSGGFMVKMTSSVASIVTIPVWVTVASGATSATFSGTAATVTATETTKITATDLSNHSAAEVLTVDVPSVRVTGLSLAPATVFAPAGSVGTVTLANAAPSGGYAVKLKSSSAYAQTPATVTVASGAKTATFAITTTQVSVNESAVVTAADANGYSATATLTVEPPSVHVQSLSISPSSVNPSQSATGTVTLSNAAPSSGFVVKLSSSAAYATTSSSVTVRSGAKTATFTIATSPVAATETATIKAADASGYSATASLTVDLPAVRLTGVDISPSAVTAANPATGKVVISASAPAGGYTVNLSTLQSFISIPSSVTVPKGSTSVTFTVMTSPVTSAGMATVSAVDGYGYASAADLTVNVPAIRLTSLSISPSSIASGATATGTVGLSANAGSAGFVVNLSTMQTFIGVPMTVTVKSGTKTATFSITASSVSANSTASVLASDVNGYTVSANLAVTPPLAIVQMTNQFSFSPQSLTVAAGTTVTFNNVSAMAHTAQSDVTGQTMNSGAVLPGATFKWTVPAGTPSGTMFFYHCAYHGSAGNGKSLGNGMAGVIVVK